MATPPWRQVKLKHLPEIERELAEIRARLDLILNPPAVAPTATVEAPPAPDAIADAAGAACNDTNAASSDTGTDAALSAVPKAAEAAAAPTPDDDGAAVNGGDGTYADGVDAASAVNSAAKDDDDEDVAEEVEEVEAVMEEVRGIVPMEEVVLTAFLLALHSTVKTADLPMLVSTFYANHVLPVCWFLCWLLVFMLVVAWWFRLRPMRRLA